MQSCEYINFDITIRGKRAPYGVTARFLDQTADGEFNQDATQVQWLRARHEMRQTIYTPNPRPMLDAGYLLYRDLFRDEIRDLWIGARAALERGTINGLRLRLALQPSAVAALPWETLCDRPRNMVPAISSRILLVRVEQEYRRLSAPAPLAVKLPLRVLIAAPTDPQGAIDAPREIEVVKQILTTLGRDQIKVHTMTGRFSVVDLRRRLEKVRPQVLHILTHGQPQGIQLWQNGRPRLVSAAALRTTLERIPVVRVVFLNACLAGQNLPDVEAATVAPQLLQAGIPAVIAMQFEIRDDVAADFAHFLYEALLTGHCAGSIDAAVTNARAGLYALNDDQLGYVTPVLWLNAPDGRIFQFDGPLRGQNGNGTEDDQEPDHGENGSNGDASNLPPSAADAVDVESETLWLEELEQAVSRLRVGPELEFALATLKQVIQTLHDLLNRLRNWKHPSRVQAYVDQTRVYRRRKAEALRLRRKLQEAI